MFTQSAVTENTCKVRDELKKYGYNLDCPCCTFRDSYIFNNPETGECHTFQEEEMPILLKEIENKMTCLINCLGNPALFLAIAAKRDDSDKYQWFVTESDQTWANHIYYPKGSFVLCLTDHRYMGEDPEYCNSVAPAHKATINELKRHFKR